MYYRTLFKFANYGGQVPACGRQPDALPGSEIACEAVLVSWSVVGARAVLSLRPPEVFLSVLRNESRT